MQSTNSVSQSSLVLHTSISEVPLQSIENQLDNLSLRENQDDLQEKIEKHQPISNSVKSQEKQNLTRYQRHIRRQSLNLILPKSRFLKQIRADLYVPQSLRAIMYSYLPYQIQFLKIRLLSHSEKRILSYVQTLEEMPDVRVNLCKKQIPPSMNLNCLWEFCGDPLFVLDNKEDFKQSIKNRINKVQIDERIQKRQEQTIEQTFYHNLGEIMKSLSKYKMTIQEKQFISFEVGCYDKFHFQNDDWLKMGLEYNIDIRVELLTLFFISDISDSSFQNYGNLIVNSQKIDQKCQSFLQNFLDENEDQLQSYGKKDGQFQCESLKIIGIVGIYDDYFKYYGNLKEFQVTNAILIIHPDFYSYNYFPINIEKLIVQTPASIVKLNDDGTHEVLSGSLLSFILKKHASFDKLQHLEIFIEDLSIAVEHIERMKNLQLLVSINYDDSFSLLQNLGNYDREFAELMKGKHMTIKIIEDIKNFKMVDGKIQNLSVCFNDIRKLLRQTFQEGLDQQEIIESWQIESDVSKIYKQNSKQYKRSSYVLQLQCIMSCGKQQSRLDIVFCKDFNELLFEIE
eukprot:403375345